MKKRIRVSDDALGWSAVAIGLIAAIVLDKDSAPHKWHAAIMWTFAAFLGLLKFSKERWGSWRFWVFAVACLSLHVFAMWAIFGQLLPRLFLGTLYVIPLAIVEASFLTGIYYRLERKLSSEHHRREHTK